jgi:glucose/arabinose dehydrogenase
MIIYRFLNKANLASSTLLFLVFLLTSIQKVSSAPPNFILTANEIVASSLSYPVQVTHPGDDTDRLFIVEQSGKIKIVANGNILSQPFLNIQSLIFFEGERGFLGLAFHPHYETNGFFYVNYTRAGDGATVIARYHVSADPNIADPNSALIIIVIPQPYSNHNGGQVAFGPDGYLYIGMGDGGSGGDPNNYAQNIEILLGKMLRINVDSGLPYTVPSDNPFVGKAGMDEIWALGLRNPWRFSFDSATGDLYIGDVGQAIWEEVDFQAAGTPGGVNFGWRCREGAHPYSSLPPCNDANFLATLRDPITEYNHSEGYSITGGFVYNGTAYPSMQGYYFFAD